MALSGSVSTSSYEGRYLTLSWSATQSVEYNQSTISWVLTANGGSSSYYYTGPVSVTIDGVVVYSLSANNRYAMYKGTVASGSIKLNHNTVGAKSFAVGISAAIFTTSVNCTGSQTFTLNNIPRYASISATVSNVTETTAVVDWSSDAIVDYIWLSLDWATTWIPIGSVNASSGYFNVTGLQSKSTYHAVVRVRRKDSQLTSNSAKFDINTYGYPAPGDLPEITIGQPAKVGIYNPLARESTVKVSVGNTTILETTTTGTSVTIPSTVADTLYQSIPNSRTGTYDVSVTYAGNTQTANGTFTAPSTSAPIIGSASYQDDDSTITTITGDNQKIIPGKSKLTFTASNLSAQNYATLSSAKVTINGTDYPMTLSGSSASVSNITITSTDSTATVYVTDSRGLTSSKAVSLDIVEYVAPTMSATARRVSGFYSNTEITPTTNYTYIGSNAVTIQLQARKTSESSYSVTQNINPSGTTTVSLDNQYPWYILLTITDSFGGSSTFEITIGKGIPLFYFDIVKSSVSMDMFPTHSNAFEVNGDIYINGEKIGDFVVEEGTDGIWTYRKWNSGRAELWGKFNQTQTAYTTNSWVVGDSSTTPYPFAITNPIAVATLRRINTGGGAILTFDYERTDYWSGLVTAVVGSYPQGTSANLSWYVYVNARWE